MKEYIDRDALLKDICGNEPSHMEDYYFNAIANAPTADVVEVVRCKDCKENPTYIRAKGMVWCRKFRTDVHRNGFCSYGERKEQRKEDAGK